MSLKFIYFLINSNIFISVAAVMKTIETQIQLAMRPQLHPYLFLILFATLFEYNLYQLIVAITKRKNLFRAKRNKDKKHLKMLYSLILISLVGFAITVFQSKKEVLLTLTPIIIITLFCSTPISKRQEVLLELGQISFLKIFVIAFVWIITIVLLPIIQSKKIFDQAHILVIFIERFLFVFAVTIPFGLQNMTVDVNSIKHFPLKIGESKAIFLAIIALLFFFLISLVHYFLTNQLFIFLAFTVSSLTTLIFLIDENTKNLRLYYYVIFGGTIFLQGILVLGFYQLKELFQY